MILAGSALTAFSNEIHVPTHLMLYHVESLHLRHPPIQRQQATLAGIPNKQHIVLGINQILRLCTVGGQGFANFREHGGLIESKSISASGHFVRRMYFRWTIAQNHEFNTGFYL